MKKISIYQLQGTRVHFPPETSPADGAYIAAGVQPGQIKLMSAPEFEEMIESVKKSTEAKRASAFLRYIMSCAVEVTLKKYTVQLPKTFWEKAEQPEIVCGEITYRPEGKV